MDHGPNYWRDIHYPEFSEKEMLVAKTVSKWRVDFLDDWKPRMTYLR